MIICLHLFSINLKHSNTPFPYYTILSTVLGTIKLYMENPFRVSNITSRTTKIQHNFKINFLYKLKYTKFKTFFRNCYYFVLLFIFLYCSSFFRSSIYSTICFSLKTIFQKFFLLLLFLYSKYIILKCAVYNVPKKKIWRQTQKATCSFCFLVLCYSLYNTKYNKNYNYFTFFPHT